MFEERVDLSNDMTGWQMIAVGVRRVILARGELDKLEGPGYAARRAELRREARARKGSAGSGVVAERGRGERSDRGRSGKRENDEGGKTASEVACVAKCVGYQTGLAGCTWPRHTNLATLGHTERVN